ncbi:MAG: enoyl-CoA hydratase/isomerase family protein, partial [Phenylobacterium sp.]
MKERYGEHLTVGLHPGFVAEVVIDRPPNNHVSVELMRQLADALGDLDKESGARCTVLRTEGKAFCAGADLVSADGGSGLETKGTNPLYDEAVRLFSVEKPIVAAIQGAAVGAGLGLAVVADFRIACAESRFSANFTRLGYHPGFGLTASLPRLIGAQ